MIPVKRRCSGFSLIELAILLTIVGLSVASILQTYRVYIAKKAFTITQSHRDDITSALAHHLFTFGYLPCPAPPGVNVGSPGAGQGAGYPDSGVTCQALVAAHSSPPWFDNAAPGASPTRGLRIVSGFRQSNQGARDSSGNPTIKDKVLIGSVPYYDLGLTISQTMDGWGNKFLYAVSYYDTQSTIVNNPDQAIELGSINIEHQDPTGDITNAQYPRTKGLTSYSNRSNYLTGLTWANTYGTYMFVVLSHGANGRGAWTYYDQQPIACDMTPIDHLTGPSPTSTGRDNENCNNDSTFLLSGAQASDGLYSLAAGPSFYDDVYVTADLNFDVDKWSHNGKDMYNKLLGNIGINNPSPTQALDVNGNIQIDRYLETQKMCDANNANCMYQNLIGGPPMNNTDYANNQHTNSCDTGTGVKGVITGFANGEAQCMTTLNITKNKGPTSCTGSQLLVGFDSKGKIVCQ